MSVICMLIYYICSVLHLILALQKEKKERKKSMCYKDKNVTKFKKIRATPNCICKNT